MATPVAYYELRWRIQSSNLPWTTARYPADSTTITITGLIRGETYEGEARAVGINGAPSTWEPVTWEMATTHREGSVALPPVTSGNVSSRWISGTEITWAADDTTCTISVSAGQLQVGEAVINYGASSAEIVGVADEVRLVYLYYDDPQFDGGTRTLGVTADAVTSMSAYGRILIDTVEITFAPVGGSTSGGGDIGGGGGGSGEGCPDEFAWFLRRTPDGQVEPVQWKDAREGDYAMIEDGRFGRLSNLRRKKVARIRVGFGGHFLTCSRSAPLRRDKGGSLLAPATAGSSMACRAQGVRTAAVVDQIEAAGAGWVVSFACEKAFVWTGDDPEFLLAHHNLK